MVVTRSATTRPTRRSKPNNSCCCNTIQPNAQTALKQVKPAKKNVRLSEQKTVCKDGENVKKTPVTTEPPRHKRSYAARGASVAQPPLMKSNGKNATQKKELPVTHEDLGSSRPKLIRNMPHRTPQLNVEKSGELNVKTTPPRPFRANTNIRSKSATKVPQRTEKLKIEQSRQLYVKLTPLPMHVVLAKRLHSGLRTRKIVQYCDETRVSIVPSEPSVKVPVYMQKLQKTKVVEDTNQYDFIDSDSEQRKQLKDDPNFTVAKQHRKRLRRKKVEVQKKDEASNQASSTPLNLNLKLKKGRRRGGLINTASISPIEVLHKPQVVNILQNVVLKDTKFRENQGSPLRTCNISPRQREKTTLGEIPLAVFDSFERSFHSTYAAPGNDSFRLNKQHKSQKGTGLNVSMDASEDKENSSPFQEPNTPRSISIKSPMGYENTLKSMSFKSPGGYENTLTSMSFRSPGGYENAEKSILIKSPEGYGSRGNHRSERLNSLSPDLELSNDVPESNSDCESEGGPNDDSYDDWFGFYNKTSQVENVRVEPAGRLTPWRFNVGNMRKNTRLLTLKQTALPSINQELVFKYEQNARMNKCGVKQDNEDAVFDPNALKLFEDFERKDSDCEEEVEEEVEVRPILKKKFKWFDWLTKEPPKKDKDCRTKEEIKEATEWEKSFNSMCKEVDEFVLEIE